MISFKSVPIIFSTVYNESLSFPFSVKVASSVVFNSTFKPVVNVLVSISW